MPTAYMAVYEWAKVQEHEIVLVHAAAGGVGSLAVQILKRKFNDVTVIGLAGSDEKVSAVKANGADHAINYKTDDYVEAVGKIAGVQARGFQPAAPPAGVHVVLNGVGGPTLHTDRRVIRKLGRWVLFGTVAGVAADQPVRERVRLHHHHAVLEDPVLRNAGESASGGVHGRVAAE